MKWQNRWITSLCLCQDQVAMLTHVEDSEMEKKITEVLLQLQMFGRAERKQKQWSRSGHFHSKQEESWSAKHPESQQSGAF